MSKEVLGSYYPDTSWGAHDGIVPRRDLRIDFKAVTGNADKEKNGIFYVGQRKKVPEDVAGIISQYISAILNGNRGNRCSDSGQPRVQSGPVQLISY